MSGPGKGWRKGTGGSLEYMQARLAPTEAGCLLWQGVRSEDGYGRASIGRSRWGLAHRRMYELSVGPVPEGLELDHLCRNRACCNPAHLEPVTRAENVRRGALPGLMRDPAFRPRRKHKAVCKNGHAMVGDNVGANAKRRWCRACKRAESARKRSMIGSKAIVADKCVAQGDGLFTRVSDVPAGYSPVKPAGQIAGKPAHVAMHSESGHDHVLDASDVIMYEGSDPMVAYLRLESDSADVVHLRSYDQHGTVKLTGGAGAVWKITRQREWDGAAERRAAD